MPDSVVDEWVRGLPGGAATSVVSLLGRKPDGLSEYSFYSFSGSFEDPRERDSRPPFQRWLDQRHPGRGLQMVEHPTTDFRRLEDETLLAVAHDIEELLSAGRTVVLMDSGGETRTRQVCKHAGFVEDPARARIK